MPFIENLDAAHQLALQETPASRFVRPQRHLYHATPESNVASIMERGLEPRAENSELNYDPCVHLAYRLGNMVGLSRMLRIVLLAYGVKPAGWNEPYRILRIDRRALPRHRFMTDLDYSAGCVTKDVVPPAAITSCGKVVFKLTSGGGILSLATYLPEKSPRKVLVTLAAFARRCRRSMYWMESIVRGGGPHLNRTTVETNEEQSLQD